MGQDTGPRDRVGDESKENRIVTGHSDRQVLCYSTPLALKLLLLSGIL